MTKCDCEERIGIEINSIKLFDELKIFFKKQVDSNIFFEVKVESPYYVWINETSGEKVEWYASKWYKCGICGTLWEFNYPDFPTIGFVRKYQNGKYTGMEVRRSE